MAKKNKTKKQKVQIASPQKNGKKLESLAKKLIEKDGSKGRGALPKPQAAGESKKSPAPSAKDKGAGESLREDLFTDDGFPLSDDPVTADDVKRLSESIAKQATEKDGNGEKAKKDSKEHAAMAGGTPPPDTPLPPDKTAENFPDESFPDDNPKKSEGEEEPMTLMGHLNELRRCLTKACIAVLVCFVGTWVVVDPIFNALVDPLLTALPPGSHAMYTTLPEGFFTRMFIAFVVGLFAASPVVFYQIWSFIAPGLYDEEKRHIIPIAFLSAIFFIGGGLFCFFVVFPFVFTFFISFATESIVAMPKVSDYLDFVLKLLIAFGLIFEMPLFSFFLSRLGIVTAKGMRGFRRYAILLIFVVAAILTPPDVVSQLLMAGPMIILYELSILIAAFFGRDKPRKKKDETGQA